METKSKIIADKEMFWGLMPLMSKFPTIHNKLSADFKLLVKITEEQINDTEKFQTLCRACLRNLFSVIEADIFYFNLFDSYENYDDRHPFIDRFKKTFKQICKTWDNKDLQQEYFSSKLENLAQLKALRDQLTHPKEKGDIIEPSSDDFKKIKNAFEDYENFILAIMSNFFFTLEPSTEKI